MEIMRKGIDYIGVETGVLIFNKEGKVFLAKRGLKARNERGKWDFPGGSVEFGETCQEAIIREIKEEYDFEIKVINFLEVVDHIIKDEHQHWVAPTFIARIKKGAPRIVEPEKCSEIKWVNLSEIDPRILTLSSQQNLKTYIKKYGYKAFK